MESIHNITRVEFWRIKVTTDYENCLLKKCLYMFKGILRWKTHHICDKRPQDMQIRGIFNFFFGLSLYSGQAAKCSRITPPAYGMDATKALEHDGCHWNTTRRHWNTTRWHWNTTKWHWNTTRWSGTCCSTFGRPSIVATFVTVTETRWRWRWRWPQMSATFLMYWLSCWRREPW